MSLLWLRPARVRGGVLVQRASADLAVHPDYQQLGILKVMRDFKDEAFRGVFDFYIGGFSKHPAIVRGRVGRTDRHPIGNRIQVRERPLTLRAALSRFGPRAGRSMRNTSGSLRLAAQSMLGLARGRGAPAERTAWAVHQVESFDERIDRLWEEASRSFGFIPERNADFLNWRYCDPRAGRFTALLAEGGGRALGYAVLQVSHGRGYLADLLVLPERLDVLDSLLAEATGYFEEAGVPIVVAWSPTRHSYNSVLHRHGFLVRPTRTRKFAYVTLHRRMEEALSFLQDPQARLHFTAGDVDVI